MSDLYQVEKYIPKKYLQFIDDVVIEPDFDNSRNRTVQHYLAYFKAGCVVDGEEVHSISGTGVKDFLVNLKKVCAKMELKVEESKMSTALLNKILEGADVRKVIAEEIEVDPDTGVEYVKRLYPLVKLDDRDIDFAAECIASRLKKKSKVTTEDVIEAFCRMSDDYDAFWSYNLRTHKEEKAFLDELLNCLEKYGITNVINNSGI